MRACQNSTKMHQFSVLIAAGQIGVGIAQTAAFLLQSEEGLDAGAGRAAGRDVVAIEPRRITPVRDGMEVHREGVGRGKQCPSQSGYPPSEQGPLVFARCPIGIVDCVRLLGRMFRPANSPRASSKLKSLMCPRRSLSRSLSVSRANGSGGGNHLCAGIVRLGDDAVEPQFRQEWQEQEDAGVACV